MGLTVLERVSERQIFISLMYQTIMEFMEFNDRSVSFSKLRQGTENNNLSMIRAHYLMEVKVAKRSPYQYSSF